MNNLDPIYLIDFYKADHRSQYPNKTEFIYSNFTPRKSRIPEIQKLVTFGTKYLVQEYFINRFQRYFFGQDINKICDGYAKFMKSSLNREIDTTHIRALWNLQTLPIKIKALPEGSLSPMQTPILTIVNTHPDFFWLTNYLETLISAVLWKPCTNATMAFYFKRAFDKYARLTGGNIDFCEFQGHDFSFRGLSSIEDACMTGAAHLLSFMGTDTVPAIFFVKEYYETNGDFVGGSVSATEHSVMSAGDEKATIIKLLTKTYPDGIVSIVSDTYDFWNLVGKFYPSIKDIILGRDGKLVIRPDTGTPHLIINGDPSGETEIEKKGLIRSLAENFGCTINEKGFKVLNPKVGAIYGDSINIQEQELILKGLVKNGFSTDCIVLGIGSYTYQYCTRDTFGIACKATWAQIDGKPVNIFKDPKTGAWKKSHKGLLRVNKDYSVTEECTPKEESEGLLQVIFDNGIIYNSESWKTIRNRLNVH